MNIIMNQRNYYENIKFHIKINERKWKSIIPHENHIKIIRSQWFYYEFNEKTYENHDVNHIKLENTRVLWRRFTILPNCHQCIWFYIKEEIFAPPSSMYVTSSVWLDTSVTSTHKFICWLLLCSTRQRIERSKKQHKQKQSAYLHS